jgi:sugar lactone lactonase YvrE
MTGRLRMREVDGEGRPVAHTLVGNLSFSMGLVAADGWLYWADENAIGRVRPDGAHLTRRFIAPPQENGGGVANGLATDGQHLFFSRCQDNEIGRVDTNGRGLALSFIKLPAKTCPQALAVGNNHVYWAELVSYVGRATLRGTGASDTWLNIHSRQGAFLLTSPGANS